jgi:hypothetical protein
LAESIEIEYSEDGHIPPAAAAVGFGATQQQQQQLQPGDFIYEFVPSVARDILSWSGLSDVSAASSFGTVGTLGTLHTTLGMGTLCGTATLAAANDAYDPAAAAAAAGFTGVGVGEGGKQQLDALLPKRWLAGKGGLEGVSASGDSSSKLARLANAEVGAKPVGVRDVRILSSDVADAAADAALLPRLLLLLLLQLLHGVQLLLHQHGWLDPKQPCKPDHTAPAAAAPAAAAAAAAAAVYLVLHSVLYASMAC